MEAYSFAPTIPFASLAKLGSSLDFMAFEMIIVTTNRMALVIP